MNDDDPPMRNNPFDPGGESFFCNLPPRSTTKDIAEGPFVEITWKASGAGRVERYRIYRNALKADNPEMPEAEIDSIEEGVYFDYTPESYPTHYYCRVSALNQFGESIRSSSVRGTRGKP